MFVDAREASRMLQEHGHLNSVEDNSPEKEAEQGEGEGEDEEEETPETEEEREIRERLEAEKQ